MSEGVLYSPAVDVTNFDESTIIVNSVQSATVDVDLSTDGETWTDYGGMNVRPGQTAHYSLYLRDYNFVRYSVTTGGSVSSSIYVGGII